MYFKWICVREASHTGRLQTTPVQCWHTDTSLVSTSNNLSISQGLIPRRSWKQIKCDSALMPTVVSCSQGIMKSLTQQRRGFFSQWWMQGVSVKINSQILNWKSKAGTAVVTEHFVEKSFFFCLESLEVSIVSVSQVPESCWGVERREEKAGKYSRKAVCAEHHLGWWNSALNRNCHTQRQIHHTPYLHHFNKPLCTRHIIKRSVCSLHALPRLLSGCCRCWTHSLSYTRSPCQHTVWTKCLVLADLSLATCCTGQTIKHLILLQRNPLAVLRVWLLCRS